MAGRSPVRPNTSTRTGIPDAASAHTSTRPTLLRASLGRSSRPSASRPATRRAGRALSWSTVASLSIRAASAGGRVSVSRGSRTGLVASGADTPTRLSS